MATQFVDPGSYRALSEQRIIRQLALEWIQSRLYPDSITFVDCLQILNQLQTATHDGYQTETIFEVVFEQACQLNKASGWLAQELQFEAQALMVPNRKEFIRACLQQSHPIDDVALDTYNERLKRLMNLPRLIASHP